MPIVITADVIDSRKHFEETRVLQKKLQAIQSAELVMPFVLLRGDEIQGVMKESPSLTRVLRTLRYLCFPLQLRIGIGIGKIESSTTAEDKEINPWLVSGEAFFLAREALESMKKKKKPVTVIKTGNPFYENICQAILILLDVIYSSWTLKQWQTVLTYEEQGTCEKAAKELGIAPQNVFKHCERAHWKEVLTAERALESYLAVQKTGIVIGDKSWGAR